jgi:hypothetical protein
LTRRRPILIVAKFADITGEAISDVIVKHNSNALVCIELSRKASFTGGVEGRVGGLVRVILACRADGARSGTGIRGKISCSAYGAVI